MDVVIAGGHGAIARRLTRLLVARGDRVRALIRNPDHVDDVRADGAEPVLVDLELATPDQLAIQITGADSVVFAAGAGSGSGPERKLTVDRDGAIKLLRAAKRAGAQGYVMVSSGGAEAPPEDDEVFSVYLRAKAAADEAVMASPLDWVVIRPGTLSDENGTGKVKLSGEPPAGSITRDDVAALAAAALADSDLSQRLLYAANGKETIATALAGARG